MRNSQLILVACFSALALAACGKSPGERAAETAIEQATGNKATVDADGNSVAIQTEQGEMKMTAGDAAKLPATYPKDVYQPEGAKVESVMEMPDTMVVQFDAPGEIASLADASGRKMAAEGWKQQLSMQQAADQQVTMYEKDKRSATISLIDDEAKGVKVNVQVVSSKQ
jgi:hypothetical protein